jgi:two-component system response regulator YcbB
VSTKAIEQRVRRSIHSGLQNIATLGLEDFSNMKFEKYSNMIYDFKDVKAEMDFIRGKSEYHGKVSAKGFLEGVLNIIQKH